MAKGLPLYELGDIGIEYEFPFSKKESNLLRSLLSTQLKGFTLVHDGSSETTLPMCAGIPIILDDSSEKTTKLLNKFNPYSVTTGTFGGEAISPVLPSEDNKWQDSIIRLCKVFETEILTPDLAKRCSIHVHVNASDSIPLKTLKNLIHLLLKYEPYLYMISGFGEENRCNFNRFTFARPIISPPAYRYESDSLKIASGYYPIFSVDSLLKAETKEEFFQALYNSTDTIASGTKYVPQRYMGLNFYSLLVRNSLEFRYANITTCPEWIISWVKLCQKFVERAEYPVQEKVTEMREVSFEGFMSFMQDLNISTPYLFILQSLYEKAKPLTWDGKHIITHASVFNFNPKIMHVEKLEDTPLDPININLRDTSNTIGTILSKLRNYPGEKIHENYDTEIFRINEMSTYQRDLRAFYKVYPTYPKHDNVDEKLTYVKNCIQHGDTTIFYPLFKPGEIHRITVRLNDISYNIQFSLESPTVLSLSARRGDRKRVHQFYLSKEKTATYITNLHELLGLLFGI